MLELFCVVVEDMEGGGDVRGLEGVGFFLVWDFWDQVG